MEKDLYEVNNIEELGKLLKELREKKQVSLEKIQKDTKIRTKYLKAIENGNIDLIPGGQVYIKGFLKSYAESIGIEANIVLQQYKNIIKEATTPQLIEKHMEKQVKKSFPLDLIQIQKFITPLLVTIIILVSIYSCFIYYRNQYEGRFIKNAEKQQSNETDKINDDILETNDSEKNSVEQVIIELIEETDEKSVYTIKNDIISVSLEMVIDRCWISVQKDDIPDYEGILKAGDTKKWEAKNNLTIRAGNPTSIKLFINGDEVQIPGNKPRNFIFLKRE